MVGGGVENLCQSVILFRYADIVCSEGVLDTGLAQRMLTWRHSGFSVHNRIRSKAADAEGRQRLARYMIRCPFAHDAAMLTLILLPAFFTSCTPSAPMEQI